MPSTPAIEHPAETELFSDALSCDGVLPVRFDPVARPVQQQAAEALLMGLAVAEDVRTDDKDDRSDLPQSVQRMEAKLDLLLGLLGRLARQREGALPVRPVRWSHRGLRIDLDHPVDTAAGTAGVAMIEPAGWLGDHIELPATVLASIASGTGSYYLWLRFGQLAPGLAEALERHLFRLHRKQIAEARQAALNAGA